MQGNWGCHSELLALYKWTKAHDKNWNALSEIEIGDASLPHRISSQYLLSMSRWTYLPPSPPIPHCCLTMSEGFSSEVNEDEKEEYRTWSLSRRGKKSTVGPSRLHPQRLALESLFAMSEPSTHSLPKVDLSNMIIRGSPWDLRTDSIILSKKSCPWESSTPSPPEEYTAILWMVRHVFWYPMLAS